MKKEPNRNLQNVGEYPAVDGTAGMAAINVL